MNKILIVGSGFSGLTIARKLADSGYMVTILESKNHIGGNCYDEVDQRTGINIHVYGPHIFHTSLEDVWNFVQKYSEFIPYATKVKATSGGQVYSLPLNLHTINQFFKQSFSPNEAKAFINSKLKKVSNPKSFEDQALGFVGEELYKAFFYGYPKKQWGRDPKELPASVLQRLPIRYNYNDNYFNDTYQALPKDGYTVFAQNLANHKNIEILYNTEFNYNDADTIYSDFEHIFFTGSTDRLYNYLFGELEYRSLTFEKKYAKGDIQGCVVMSYPEESVPYTRITEHKYFHQNPEQFDETVYYIEYSHKSSKDFIPYYPVRLAEGNSLWEKYEKLLKKEHRITFVGRLATFRYLDMDKCIYEALLVADRYIANNK